MPLTIALNTIGIFHYTLTDETGATLNTAE